MGGQVHGSPNFDFPQRGVLLGATYAASRLFPLKIHQLPAGTLCARSVRHGALWMNNIYFVSGNTPKKEFLRISSSFRRYSSYKYPHKHATYAASDSTPQTSKHSEGGLISSQVLAKGVERKGGLKGAPFPLGLQFPAQIPK